MAKPIAQLSGTVKRNIGRGKKLGYPTANIDIDDAGVAIPDGIFVGFTAVQGRRWPSLVFVGIAETFGETKRRVETYLLDFSGDLYGKKTSIEIIKRIRDNKKFASEEELIAQMKKDEQVARVFFTQYNRGK